jgi:hypothetical protein
MTRSNGGHLVAARKVSSIGIRGMGLAVGGLVFIAAAGIVSHNASAATRSSSPPAAAEATATATATARAEGIAAAADPYLTFRQTLVNLRTAEADHDFPSVARFRAELTALLTPELRAVVRANVARLRSALVAADRYHDARMRALFGRDLALVLPYAGS